MRFFPLTALASLIWCSLTALHRSIRRFSPRRSIRLPVRVLAVGNFEAGGTGKTPVVAVIAREAVSKSFIPVILSRGYGGRWEKSAGVIDPSGAGRSETPPDPRDCGDEPALLHELVPSAWIGVGADRASAFERVISRARELGLKEPDLAILDDGLQHLALERDLEIVLQTSARPWQKLFREFPGTRRVPSVFVWTKGSEPPLRWTLVEPAIRVRWRSAPLRAESSQSPLWLVTGVADGSQVRDSLETHGWTVAAHSNCSDHARYTREWIEEILRRAASGGLRPATTGKDWVKWRALGVSPESTLVFEPEIVWDDEGRRIWSRVLWGA